MTVGEGLSGGEGLSLWGEIDGGSNVESEPTGESAHAPRRSATTTSERLRVEERTFIYGEPDPVGRMKRTFL